MPAPGSVRVPYSWSDDAREFIIGESPPIHDIATPDPRPAIVLRLTMGVAEVSDEPVWGSVWTEFSFEDVTHVETLAWRAMGLTSISIVHSAGRELLH